MLFNLLRKQLSIPSCFVMLRKLLPSHYGEGLGVGLLLLFTACNDNAIVNRKYCDLPARFTFTPVNSIQQLYSSCENPGEWCTVTMGNNKILFKKSNGSAGEANLLALDGYKVFYLGLSGLIIGRPNIPEMGYDYAVVTCYDLACPNCYTDFSVARAMTLKEGGYATCGRCQRTYNLNSTGIVQQGEGGRPLYRYRIYYAGNTVAVDNR